MPCLLVPPLCHQGCTVLGLLAAHDTYQCSVLVETLTGVQVRMHYYEWWSRALKPGVHFVEVDEGDAMCDDIVRKVRL